MYTLYLQRTTPIQRPFNILNSLFNESILRENKVLK